jgi:hypothetical protein
MRLLGRIMMLIGWGVPAAVTGYSVAHFYAHMIDMAGQVTQDSFNVELHRDFIICLIFGPIAFAGLILWGIGVVQQRRSN